MKLTSIHDNHITASQIAACFKTFVHVFTFASSPAAISIWNPHHKQSINAINHKIPNTRLMAVLTVFMALGWPLSGWST
jgi:hypothetical protein